MAAVSVHQSTPGDDFEALVAAYNELATAFIALCAKLDDDAGVTDTNYEATQAAGIDTVVLSY
jgi:hypothetical protein